MGISTIWIYGEATNGSVSTTTLELITGARQLADTVEVIVHGDASALASQLGEYGAAGVKSIGDLGNALPGPQVASAIAGAIAEGNGPSAVLCATTYDGRDVAGRLSAKIDTPVITNVVELKLEGDRLLGVEPVFGGATNVTTGFTGSSAAIFLVRPKSFEADPSGGAAASVGDMQVGDTGNTNTSVVKDRFVEETKIGRASCRERV